MCPELLPRARRGQASWAWPARGTGRLSLACALCLGAWYAEPGAKWDPSGPPCPWKPGFPQQEAGIHKNIDPGLGEAAPLISTQRPGFPSEFGELET